VVLVEGALSWVHQVLLQGDLARSLVLKLVGPAVVVLRLELLFPVESSTVQLVHLLLSPVQQAPVGPQWLEPKVRELHAQQHDPYQHQEQHLHLAACFYYLMMAVPRLSKTQDVLLVTKPNQVLSFPRALVLYCSLA